ncbi:MAG: 16S rRNA (cytidine(1402)-2'-O)-methyltransferase [Gammaproteobacteria bacterium]
MMSGILYVVATPIGNLADISMRASDTLKQVDMIAVEDTRHSQRLLQHLGIHKPLLALHEHNETSATEQLLNTLQAGKNVALISDAGTPLINDPGYQLVTQCHIQNIPVRPIPGPCALITALCAAGLPTDKFIFEGFLPAKTHAKQQRLNTLKHETRTMIFYEAPHRLLATLDSMLTYWEPQRMIVLARELTKTFETIHSDTLENLHQFVAQDAHQQKGECVLLVHGFTGTIEPETEHAVQVLKTLLNELPLKQATRLAAQLTNINKNQLYQWALALKDNKL